MVRKKGDNKLSKNKERYIIQFQRGFLDMLKIVSFILILIGIVLLIGFGTGITGNVIGFEDSSSLNYVGMLVGIVLIVGGILIGISKQSKLEIQLVDISNGKDKNHERAYAMIDQEGAFESEGSLITLGQMRSEVNRLFRSDPSYVEHVKSVYLPPLREKALRGSEEERKIAREFLDVLGEEIREQRTEGRSLSREERNEIKMAFRDWKGTPTSRQEIVLEKYGLRYEEKSGRMAHPKIFNNHGTKITASSSPSDYRTGRNMATQIIKLIEER